TASGLRRVCLLSGRTRGGTGRRWLRSEPLFPTPEKGETVYRRRSDLRRAQLEAEAKSLEAIKVPVDESTRVESGVGPVPRGLAGSWNPEGLIGEAVAGLI